MPAINFEERLIKAGVAIEPVVAFDKATDDFLLLDFTAANLVHRLKTGIGPLIYIFN